MSDKPNPHITVGDHEGKPKSGKYISHEKTGRYMATVVLEDAKGKRFRLVTTLGEIEDALEVGRR